MVEHHGVVNLVLSRPDAFGLTPTGNVAQFFSFGFDGSVMDTLSTLCFGGSLHVLPDNIKMDRVKLWEYLQHQSITQAILPPAILQECKDLPPLEMPLALPVKLLQSLNRQPTEATVSAVAWKCPPGFDGELVPIGDLLPTKRSISSISIDSQYQWELHSLLAVRMITQIQSLMGSKVTLGTLFMAPTIAELVPHLLTAGNTQEDAFDVLLPIKPRGTRLPLFCVHHGFGQGWSFIGLSRHLHPAQPIYGLQARGFFDSGQLATTLEDMALDYIEQISRIQPHGL